MRTQQFYSIEANLTIFVDTKAYEQSLRLKSCSNNRQSNDRLGLKHNNSSPQMSEELLYYQNKNTGIAQKQSP